VTLAEKTSLQYWRKQATLDSGINIGVCLLIFEKNLKEKNEKCQLPSLTFIQGGTSIPQSRVHIIPAQVQSQLFLVLCI
jgi:hypothetical protein